MEQLNGLLLLLLSSVVAVLLRLAPCHKLPGYESHNNLPPGFPQIEEHPLDTIIPKGEPLTLNCKASGNPTPQIIWYKDGELLSTANEESSSHRVLLPSGSLFFLRVHQGKNQKPDSGTYWCVARNAKGEARSNNATLKIAMLKEEFRIKPKSVPYVAGSQAILECSPPKGYPEAVVFWKKDSRELKLEGDARRTVHPSGNLIISNVQPSDSGFYTCVARNMVGTRESSAARLTVYEKPELKQAPEDLVTEVGSEAVFSCKISGDPSPVITWRKKDGKLPIGRSQILEDRSLRIDRVVSSDDAEYICTGKNPAGSVDASARLIVQSPPWFVVEPKDMVAEEGSQVTLKCEANGNPVPAIFWSKEGAKELMFPGHLSSDKHFEVTASGDLIIRNFRTADEGYYLCSALNAAGSSSVKALLKLSGESSGVIPPPLILRGPANQTLPLNSLAILPCSVLSVGSSPSITWLKDRITLTSSDRVMIHPGALQIRGLQKSDSGLYTCKAANEHGEDSWSAELIIEDHTNPNVIFRRMPEPSTFPSPPGRPQVVNVTSTVITLQWDPPTNEGFSPVVGYRLQYFSPQIGLHWNNPLDIIRTNRFALIKLKPSSYYLFAARAENNYGISEPSPLSVVVRTTSNVGGVADVDFELEMARKSLTDTQLVKLREVKPINASAVRVTWKLLRPEPLITGFYIRWQGAGPNQQGLRNVSARNGGSSWSTVVSSLQPYTTYKFFVIPYFRTVEGTPSNSLDGVTEEAVPSAPPSDVQVRMMNLTTLRISWKPPPREYVNGLLRGYQILVLSNDSRLYRNITTGERAASVTLFRLVAGMTYRIRVSAFNTAGMGIQYSEDVVTMNEATLQQHLALELQSSSQRWREFAQEPWFIACIGAFMWLLLVAVVATVWWRRRRLYKTSVNSSGPFIKINDGSVLNSARDVLWIDPHQYYGAHCSHPGTLAVAPLNNGYVLNTANADSPSRFSGCGEVPPSLFVSTSGEAQLHPDAERPYTELSQLNYPMSGGPAPSYYHQIPLTTTTSVMQGGGCQQCNPPPASPTPYATTTLVMNAHNQRLYQQQNLLMNALPYGDHQNCVHGRVTAVQAVKHNHSATGNSPPHTDVSYVSGGTGSANSVNGGKKIRPHQPPLLDFLPPPPTQPPPPAGGDSFLQGQPLFSGDQASSYLSSRHHLSDKSASESSICQVDSSRCHTVNYRRSKNKDKALSSQAGLRHNTAFSNEHLNFKDADHGVDFRPRQDQHTGASQHSSVYCCHSDSKRSSMVASVATSDVASCSQSDEHGCEADVDFQDPDDDDSSDETQIFPKGDNGRKRLSSRVLLHSSSYRNPPQPSMGISASTLMNHPQQNIPVSKLCSIPRLSNHRQGPKDVV